MFLMSGVIEGCVCVVVQPVVGALPLPEAGGAGRLSEQATEWSGVFPPPSLPPSPPLPSPLSG